MALKSLPSYHSLPSPEITLAKIINTCMYVWCKIFLILELQTE